MPFLVFSEEQNCQACACASGMIPCLVEETTEKSKLQLKVYLERKESKQSGLCVSVPGVPSYTAHIGGGPGQSTTKLSSQAFIVLSSKGPPSSLTTVLFAS